MLVGSSHFGSDRCLLSLSLGGLLPFIDRGTQQVCAPFQKRLGSHGNFQFRPEEIEADGVTQYFLLQLVDFRAVGCATKLCRKPGRIA
jgi:hypothetical protein